MTVTPLPYSHIVKQCAECGRTFKPSSRHRRCPACRAKAMCACGRPMQAKSVQCGSCRTTSNDANGNWKGGRTLHKAGYVMVRVPEHPRTNKSPYVFEHILVAEQLLGRYLEPGESVHHRNGIRDDNRPENLELWTKPQPAGIRVSDAIAWAVEILDRYMGEGRGTPPTMLTAPEHSWRWRESNPRLPSCRRDFSERSRWRDLGSPPPTGSLRRPQPRCDVPPGHEARPGGKPL